MPRRNQTRNSHGYCSTCQITRRPASNGNCPVCRQPLYLNGGSGSGIHSKGDHSPIASVKMIDSLRKESSI